MLHKQAIHQTARSTSNANNRVYRNAMSPRKFRPNAYQVCVNILKAKYLPQNANPMVVVKVGNRRKKTVVREKTDTPVYNEVKISKIHLPRNLRSLQFITFHDHVAVLCIRFILQLGRTFEHENYDSRIFEKLPSFEILWKHEIRECPCMGSTR